MSRPVLPWGRGRWNWNKVRLVASAAVAVGAACLTSPLRGAEPGLSSGVFFWGEDAMGMGQGVTFPSEILDLVATDNVFYCLSLDGNVAQVAGGGPYQEFQVPPEATNVVALSAGAYHMMALRADGRVIAWGAPGFVPRDLILAVPSDLTNAVAIAAGYDHCLALRSDGRIAAWGVNSRGQLDVPDGLSNVVAISAGQLQCYAVRSDGIAVAWGWNNKGQTQLPTDLRGVTKAAGGSSLAAAVTPAPRILDPPGYIDADAGRDAEFTVRLLNQPNAAIYWWLNDSPIPGATNISLLLANLQAEHAGTCTIVVTSASWPEQRASAQFAVRPMAPWFLESPQDLSARPGEPVELRCLARGTEPISYQWLRNGQLLEGASQPILSLPFLTPQQGGFYTVIARNEVGTSLVWLVDGTVVAWGGKDHGGHMVPSMLSDVVALVAECFRALAPTVEAAV